MDTKIKLDYPDGSNKTVNDDIIQELYYSLARISKKYTKSQKNKIKEYLAGLEEFIPLYDIFSKNIYIIHSENVYVRVTDFHYRFPNASIIKRIKQTLKVLSNDDIFKEKLEKNVAFLDNFDMGILEKTYYKLFYLSQPKIQELTSCVKPSFIPFMTKKPYYTKSELINLALNMNLNIGKNIEDICKIVSQNDIQSSTILSHQMYIKSCAKSYIQLYTLLGSYYWNYYIRNVANNVQRDLYTETQISRLNSIIKKAPSFDKDYYVYRFIDNDNYLEHLKINDDFIDSSFISTTRNPFYDTKNNTFGFILLKIKIPGNVPGVGLCIESYSLFPNEEEIILSPCKLKLVSIDESHKYYHPSKKAALRIKKMYTFEYVFAIPTKDTSEYVESVAKIPTINWLRTTIPGTDFASKVYNFHNTYLAPINNKKYFNAMIGDKTYLFHVFYLDDNPIYEKYFFLQRNDNHQKEEIYFMVHDEMTGEIILIIELRDIISVNYLHKYTGTPEQPYQDTELLTFIASIAYCFEINQVIIHDEYKSYTHIASKLLKGTSEKIFNEINPDNHLVSLFSSDFNYYNSNILNHINKQVTRFSDIAGVRQNLKNHHFKRYSLIDSMLLFQGTIKSPLYNILIKLNKTNNTTMLLDFYKHIHNNYFYMIKELNRLIVEYDDEIFNDTDNNPWTNSYTILNTSEYLYDHDLISSIRTFQSNIYRDYLQKLSEEHRNISFNKYRLGLV
jgi:hypothetical protein